jgi:hypothetical protein
MAAISRLILCEKNSNAACGREENLEREPISRGDAEFAETKRPSSQRSLRLCVKSKCAHGTPILTVCHVASAVRTAIGVTPAVEVRTADPAG